jgi:hypothetical protein
METVISADITAYKSVDSYCRFGGTNYLLLQGRFIILKSNVKIFNIVAYRPVAKR